MTSEEEKKDKDETLKTFDMYHCFSRVDVILAIALVLGLLLFAVWHFLTPQPV